MPIPFIVMEPGTAYTAARSVLEVTADSVHVLDIVSVALTQQSLSTDDRVEARILRKTAAGTGTARTPAALDGTGSVFGGTARSNMTAEGTLGDILHEEGFSILQGFFWVQKKPLELVVPPSGIIAVDIDAPAASTTFLCAIQFDVIGLLT